MSSDSIPIFYFLIGILQFSKLCQAQSCSKLNLTQSEPKFNGFQYMFLDMDTIDDVMVNVNAGVDDTDNNFYPTDDGDEDGTTSQENYKIDVNFLTHALSADPIIDEIGDGLIDPNFQVDIPNDSDGMTTLFNQTIDGTNFGLLFNRFFVPKITGSYKFSISADGAGLVSIMNSFDYYCCQNVSYDGYDVGDANANFLTEYSNIIADTGNSTDIKEVILHLEAGSVSLLQMIAVNRGGKGRFNFTIIDPNGKSLIGLPDYIADVEITPICNKVVSSIVTANVTSTTTYSTDFLSTTANELEIPEFQTIYYVMVPYIGSTSSSSMSSVSSSMVSLTSSSSVTSTNSFTSNSYNETSSSLSLTSTDNSISSNSSSTSRISLNSQSNTADGTYSSSSFTLSLSESSMTLSNLVSKSTIAPLSSSNITVTYNSAVQLTTTNMENGYANSSSVTESSEKLFSSTDISTIKDNESSKIQMKTTERFPCTKTECATELPEVSMQYTTRTVKCRTTVTTPCSVTHLDSVDVIMSTYTREVETIVTQVCSGNCGVVSLDNLVPETVTVQEAGNTYSPLTMTSASIYLVDSNKNKGNHFSTNIGTIFISLLSIFTMF
ncbi:hypothetical protein C6P45_003146 [Maudiozyma exigua]|uniref:PA14 domain-containing protein n=1 Tax=Maudiozyma exigua TaxID=34358 RepID=A0A9P6VV95_MAUEX|nr:hypothetical protein C6P45_003146 [Kazachstania exigua]